MPGGAGNLRSALFVLAAVLLPLIALGSCTGGATSPSTAPAPAPAPPATLDDDARRWVDETLTTLTLRQAVAQLVIPWIPGGYASESDPEFLDLLGWVERGLGGVSISIGVPDAYVAKLNRLQSRARIPLLVTSDFENGGPGMRINHSYAIPSLLAQGGGTSFPPTMAFGAAGDEKLAFEYGRITAVEARAVGVHWLFAPVLDVNSNPENPVINTRSFGEDPGAVGRLGAAFIRGARVGGALTTAKHFPGHGDTRTDSHIELPVIGADRGRLDRVELVPFRTALAAGVDAVMTAHVAVPGVLGDARPATMSPELMTDLLRGEMGFDGVLFTDALLMGAITDGYGAGEAAVLALEAGSDVLLAPAGIGVTVEAVTAAVEAGRVTRERIDESVRRLLEAKARLGLHRGARVDPEAVATRVGTAEHRAMAERAAAASLTLVRDRDDVLPLAPGSRVLSVTYARPDALLAGRTFDATLASSSARVSSARVGPDTPWAVYDSLVHAAREVDAVVVGAYVPPRSGVGSVGVPAGFRAFVERVHGLGGPRVAIVSFGSPYLLTAFPDAGTYMVAWGGWEVSQRAAARAVTGAAAVSGRLPISIPPLHRAGRGAGPGCRGEGGRRGWGGGGGCGSAGGGGDRSGWRGGRSRGRGNIVWRSRDGGAGAVAGRGGVPGVPDATWRCRARRTGRRVRTRGCGRRRPCRHLLPRRRRHRLAPRSRPRPRRNERRLPRRAGRPHPRRAGRFGRLRRGPGGRASRPNRASARLRPPRPGSAGARRHPGLDLRPGFAHQGGRHDHGRRHPRPARPYLPRRPGSWTISVGGTTAIRPSPASPSVSSWCTVPACRPSAASSSRWRAARPTKTRSAPSRSTIPPASAPSIPTSAS